MAQTLKISGLIELEIELPDGLRLPLGLDLGSAQATTKPDAPTTPDKTACGFPYTRNGRLAEKVAAFIQEAGPAGVTRHQITKRFTAIKSDAQRQAVLKLLPELFYRRTTDPKTGKGNPAERWTYFYSNEEDT